VRRVQHSCERATGVRQRPLLVGFDIP